MLSQVLIDIRLASEAVREIPDVQAPLLLLLLEPLLTPVAMGKVCAFALCILEDCV